MIITQDDLATDRQQRFMSYEPSDKQKSFHRAGGIGAAERLFLAGNRTGKTFCGCMEDAMHLTGRYPNWWQGVLTMLLLLG